MADPGYCTAVAPADCRLTATNPTARTHAESAALLASVEGLIRRLARDAAAPAGVERDDIAQEIRLTLWKALPRWDPAKAKITTFTSAVARQVLADLAGGRGRRFIALRPQVTTFQSPDFDLEPDRPEEDPPADRGCAAEEADRLEMIAGGWLDELGPGERLLFELLAVERVSVEAAADRLGQKVSVVTMRLGHLVKKLLASGKIPPELLDRFRRWQQLDAVRPAKAPKGGRETYAEQMAKRRARKLAKGGGPAPAAG